MIAPDFIQTLLARIDIVDVIDRHVTLKKAGANYVACCPFHHEKTPSFTVSPSKQFYHCFGCGAHGSAIGFVMNYGGADFVEAVHSLAQEIGLTVPNVTRAVARAPDEPAPETLTGALRQAMDYYRAQLKSAERAIGYLKQRGLSGAICARFAIGYAPDGWQNLASVFTDYQGRVLKDAGLVVDGDKGKRYDRFRDRIVFPIFNQKNEVIGFGGRVIDSAEGEGKGSPGPKYLNSPETPIFEKGRELYGFTHARRAIREAGRVLVVEGYMDVLGLAQHGVEYAVATLGTATTPLHVQKLMRHAEEVVFCFDGDAAGQRAAWRALEVSLAHVADAKRVAFLFLPAEHDPDSFVRQHGREAFEALIAKALPLSAYLLQGISANCDLSIEEGRARLLQNAKPLLEQIRAPALSLMLRKRLADMTGVTRTEAETVLGRSRSTWNTNNFTPGRANAAARVQRKPPSLIAQLTALVMAQPEAAHQVELELNAAVSGELKVLAEVLSALREGGGALSTAALVERFHAEPFAAYLRERAAEAMALSERFNETELDQELAGAARRLAESFNDQRIDEYTQKARLGDLSVEEKRKYRELLASRR